MIRIGITWCDNLITQSNYSNWIARGREPVDIITLHPEQSSHEDILSCDGIVISGGVDIEPERHGQARGYPHQPDEFDPQRDAFEYLVLHLSQQHEIPLLGICRGMQLINCALGGSLNLDNGDTANHLHQGENYQRFHPVEIVPGTLLHRICRSEQALVNSQHHQSIDRLAHGLVVNCHFDGMIEGVERHDPAGKPFLLGVQWHPEAMYKYGAEQVPSSCGVRDTFLTAVSQSQALQPAGES